MGKYMELGSSVADPDPHSLGKLDPDPHESQNSEALEAQNEAMEGLGRSHWRCRGSK